MDPGASSRQNIHWNRLQVQARRIFNRIPFQENQKTFILTLLIGAVCGLAAVCFHLLLEFFQDNIIYRAAALTHWWRIPLVLLIPAVGGLIAGAGLYFYAPEARGSGIPQVKTAFYLDHGRIPARVIWGKMFLAALNIGTGASLGREGPTVQICAAIASLLGRVFAISRRNLRNLIPVGAAAGLAAAFNTPIAAVTFTMEEILGDSAAKPLGSIVIAAVIASVIERSLLGAHPIFSVPAYELNGAVELLFYALLGLLAGLVSIAFSQSLLFLRALSRKQQTVPQWATPAVGGLVLGFVGLAALTLTGSPSIFGVGYAQLSVALQGTLIIKVVIILGICKLAGTVISYGTGSSGGIFGPALYIGGMLGGAVGLFAQFMHANPHTQAGAFALVGMGAVFAGIVRAPVTSIVMIFEMTNNYSIILPLMISNIISYVLATKLSPTPIYDALLQQDDIHLPHNEHHALRQIPVSAAMTRTVVTIPGNLKVGEVYKLVQGFPVHYHAYPVVDDSSRLVGLVTFNDVKRAMASNQEAAMISSISRKKLVHAHPDHPLDRVLLKLGREKISQLPVVSRKDPSKLLGIITMHDVAGALAKGDDSTEMTIQPASQIVEGEV